MTELYYEQVKSIQGMVRRTLQTGHEGRFAFLKIKACIERILSL